jgi:hypothetical protein
MGTTQVRRFSCRCSTTLNVCALLAWPVLDEYSGGYHKTVLVLSALSLLEFATRPSSSPYPAPLSVHGTSAALEHQKKRIADTDVYAPWFPSALALGALVFSLHERLMDPNTLIAWSWTGFPLKGPIPHVHAPLTLFAQAVGVLLALTSFPSRPLWYALGLLSAYTLYTYKDWPGYIGSLTHAVFLMSVTPHILKRAGRAARLEGAARVFGVAWGVWVIFIFTGTFTVAYAFVPGAWSFREHTD